MVKFGEELESALFPLWKSYYVDYGKLKKALKSVCEHYPYMALLERHGVHIQNDPSKPFELVICGALFSYHECPSSNFNNNDNNADNHNHTNNNSFLNATQQNLVLHANERLFVRVTQGLLPSTVAASAAVNVTSSNLISDSDIVRSGVVSDSDVAAGTTADGAAAASVGASSANHQFISIQSATERAAPLPAAAAAGNVAVIQTSSRNPDDDGWAPPITHPHFIDAAITIPSAAVYESDPNTANDSDMYHARARGLYKLIAAIDAKNVMKLRYNDAEHQNNKNGGRNPPSTMYSSSADFDGDNVVRKCLDFSSKGYIYQMVRAYRQAAREAEALAGKKGQTATASLIAGSATPRAGGGGSGSSANNSGGANGRDSKEKEKDSGGGGAGGFINSIGGAVMMVFDPSLKKALKVAKKAAAAAGAGGGSGDDPSAASSSPAEDEEMAKKAKEEEEEGLLRYFRIVATAAAEKPSLISMRFYLCTTHASPTVNGGVGAGGAHINNSNAVAADGNGSYTALGSTPPTNTAGGGGGGAGGASNNEGYATIRHLANYANPSIGHALYCYQHMVSNVLASVIKSEIEKVSNFYISQSHMVCSSALLCVDAVKMWHTLSIKEKSQLRIAFRQTYSTFDMIQQYCDLNCVAVGKILKKMDKNTHQNMLEAYRHAIEDEGGLIFRMGRNSRVHKLQRILTEYYGRYVMGGDHKKGMEYLDAREFISRRDQQPTLLSLTALGGIVGTMIYFVVTTMWSMSYNNADGSIFPTGSRADVYGAYLALIPLVVVAMTFLFSINVMVWEYFGINFAFMFELDPIFHWSGAELMRDSLMYVLVWLACVYHFLLMNSQEGGMCGHSGWITTTTTTSTITDGAGGIASTITSTVLGTIMPAATTAVSTIAATAALSSPPLPLNVTSALFPNLTTDLATTITAAAAATAAANTTTSTTTTTFVDNTSVYILYCVWPLWLLVFVAKAVFNSYAFNNRKPWIAIICKRIVTTPMTSVKFADFFIADQITSFTGIFFELQWYWCVWFAPSTDDVCHAGRSMGLCFFSILPNTWRLIQCFRRFRDQPKATRKPFPNLVNAGKYASSIAEILVWMIYNILKFQDVFGAYQKTAPDTYVDSEFCAPYFVRDEASGAILGPKSSYYATTTVSAAATTATAAIGTTTFAPPPAECVIEAAVSWVSGADELWLAFMIACGVSIFSQIYKFLWDIVVDAGIWVKVTPPPPQLPHWKLRDEKIYREWWPYIAFVVEDFILRSVWAIKFWVAPWTKGVGWMFAFWSILEVFRRFVWNFFRVENEHVNNTEGYRATKLAPTPAKQIAAWDCMADEMTEKFLKDKNKTSAEFPTIRGINLTGVTKFFAQLPEEEKRSILLQKYGTPAQLSAAITAHLQRSAAAGKGGAHHNTNLSAIVNQSSLLNRANTNNGSALSSAPSSPAPLLNSNNSNKSSDTNLLQITTSSASPFAATAGCSPGEGKSRLFSEFPEEEKVILVLNYLKTETMNDYLKRIGVVKGEEGGKIVGGSASVVDGASGSSSVIASQRRSTIVAGASPLPLAPTSVANRVPAVSAAATGGAAVAGSATTSPVTTPRRPSSVIVARTAEPMISAEAATTAPSVGGEADFSAVAASAVAPPPPPSVAAPALHHGDLLAVAEATTNAAANSGVVVTGADPFTMDPVAPSTAASGSDVAQ